jgi:hypothetical protein
MRGVFIAQQSLFSSINFTTIAETLAPYGINTVLVESVNNYKTLYQSQYVPTYFYNPVNFTECINTFHSYGIQVYAHFDTMLRAYAGDGIKRNAWYLPSGGTEANIQEYYGNGWLDIANPYAQSLVHDLINELVTNYPELDGICFDYTRWDDYMPLGNCTTEEEIASNYDRLSLISYTGLSDVVWPDDVLPVANGGTGKYLTEFREWRCDIINDFVKNMTEWALAINPNLKFGASPHSIGSYGLPPDYWPYQQGQDPIYWIKEGYIDWVAPMIYSDDVDDYTLGVEGYINYATGTAHGLVPICPFISNQLGGHTGDPYNFTTEQLKEYVDAIISAGGDGWIIWEYGGPGDGTNSGSPDIRPYLDALGLPNPPTFTLGNIALQSLNSTSIEISWDTTLETNSTVECSSSPLYTWAMVNNTQNTFYYWKITHVPGIVVENSTLATTHSVIITGLPAPYYIHIMSGDPSGIAAVYKFYMGA